MPHRTDHVIHQFKAFVAEHPKTVAFVEFLCAFIAGALIF